MTGNSSERFVLLNHLADEFAGRYRRGERPSLQEYIDRHPELADDIREFFPAMVEMEQVKEAREEVTEPPSPGSGPPPDRLGDYRIIREIGRGGMGIVYEAEQVSLGRHVALKVLPRQDLTDARTRQRFEREARSAARLHHTNIVPVFGVGEHEGLPYYVMQFILGSGLDEVLEELRRLQPVAKEGSNIPRSTGGEPRVARGDVAAADVARSLLTGQFRPAEDEEPTEPETSGDRTTAEAAGAASEEAATAPAPATGRPPDSFSLSSSSVVLPGTGASQAGKKRPTYWQSVARIGAQVADALGHAHAQGVLHRDIKPSNLLLDTLGVVWVTDFGLAKADDQKNLTHTGDILGTLRYMAPEAFDGRTDARSDVYSLGLTLYELLAMRPAFDEKERNRLIKQVTSSEPARLDRLNPEVPRDLVTIVQKAIDRDPAHRYPAASELMADLQRFLDDEPIQARRQTQGERFRRWARRNPGIAALGGVLTAVLLLATVASLIVAGRMTSLARDATRAANEERLARTDAEHAKEQEATQREQAEAATKAADASREQAVKALREAEENSARARAAVNEYLTAVSDDPRLKAPGLSPLRAQLLQSALGFYQQFLRERGTDAALRKELAAVYFKVGRIFQDLGQPQPANQSFAESRRLYEALAADAPDDTEIQDGLANSFFRQEENDRAIAIWEKLVRPDDPRYQSDLGWAYNAVAFLAENDKAKNLKFLRKALMVRERLVRLRPDDAEAREGLAASLNNIAVALTPNGHAAHQLALSRRAVSEMEIAYKLQPSDSLTARGVVTLMGNLAPLAKGLGFIEEALAAHRRRVEVLDRRARDNPAVPGFDAELVQGYAWLLQELREAGRWDEAAKVADRARERIAETTEETAALFSIVSSFHMVAHSVAVAREKAVPGGAANTEREAAAVVNALRQFVLAGMRDANWMRTDPRTEPLRQRDDFKELLARMDELAPADAKARSAAAAPDEKVAARRIISTALEALAAPLPPARFIRRNLAQARQDLGQALLDAGRFEEARAALDEALAVRQKLLEEAPTDETLRSDLVESQVSTGDFLAAAGRLDAAGAAWEKGLATLEADLKANPNRFPLGLALSERLLHVGHQYARVGLLADAVRCYRRAFEVQVPAEVVHSFRFAMLMAETGDSRGFESLAARVAAHRGNLSGADELDRARALLLALSSDARWSGAVRELTEDSRHFVMERWDRWVHAFARVRLGQEKDGIARLAGFGELDWKWPVVALAEHRLGRQDAAREALRQADLAADRLTRDAAGDHPLRLTEAWQDWIYFRLLRREAHQAIEGKPLPDSPDDHLFRGRVQSAFGRAEKGEAEFAAAVALRPDDVDVWLARARVFARLGRKDRMAADLATAQRLEARDPKPWIATGRMLAELGETRPADAAFARASALASGELNPFLEAGWWVVGPYPERLDLPCPPEDDPDPSRPVAAVGDRHTLKWQAVSTTPGTGRIDMGTVTAGMKNASFYALAYVHTDRERTATLTLRAWEDARLWVNGRLVFDGFAPWRIGSGTEIPIPILLRAGRNRLLVKARRTNGPAWCACRFHHAREGLARPDQDEDHFARLVMIAPDQPRLWIDRGRRLGELGRWDEAARAFAKATELAPREPHVWKERGRAYAGLGKWDEAAADLARALELTPEPRPNFPEYPWRAGRGEIDELIARSDELSNRVAGQRPQDPTLSARRAEHLAEVGRWAEAEAALRKHVDRFPVDWWAPTLLATLLLHEGKGDDSRQVCRRALDRLDGHAEPYASLNIGRSALLAPAGFEDHPISRKTIADADQAQHPEFWMQFTAALAEFRRGDAASSSRRLEARVTPIPEFDNTQALADALRALAYQKAGHPAEAQAALSRAQNTIDRHRHWPEPGAQADEWHNWAQVQILVRQARELIPTAPAVAAPASEDKGQTARRERKARADRVSTQAALALIRVDIGEKKEAEAELRAVLAEWVKLVAEEPANADYQADLAAIHQRLGQVLTETGRVDEGIQQIQAAVSLLEKLGDASPMGPRIHRELASAHLAIGEAARKANRPDQAGRALRSAVDILTRAIAANPKSPAVEWLMLAVSQGWLGEKDPARKACRKAAELLRPAVADAAPGLLIRKAMLVVGLDSPEAAELLAAAAGEPPAALIAAIRQDPDGPQGYLDRGAWYGRHGLWKKAADDLTATVRMVPDSITPLQLGILLVHLGEMDRYREHCQAMFARYAETTRNNEAERTVKTCLLHADSRVDPDRLAKLVQVAISGDPNQPYVEWFLLAKGLHAYRMGRYAEALTACRDSRRRNALVQDGTQALTASDLAVEAMALRRQGDAAAARQSLGQAKQLLDDGFSVVAGDGWWHDWLAAYVQYREAETLIEGPKGATK